jgi:hypothetical protein
MEPCPVLGGSRRQDVLDLDVPFIHEGMAATLAKRSIGHTLTHHRNKSGIVHLGHEEFCGGSGLLRRCRRPLPYDR